VFLDYTNFQTRLNQMTTAAGVTNLSAAEVATIQSGIMSKVGTIYNGFTISFTQTLPTGNHETVTFGNTATAGTFGQAQEIDFRNLNPNDVANVYTGNFGFAVSSTVPRDQMISQLTTALAGTAAHELGHDLGLQHGDSYGDPGITPANYSNTAGIQNTHIMATGSTGITNAQRETDRSFSKLELAKLEFGQGLTSTAHTALTETTSAHGTTATAQAVTLQSLPISGTNGAVVLAAIAATGEKDYYQFTATAGMLFTANIISDVLTGRYAKSVDTIITLYGPNGTTVLATNDDTQYDGNSFNGSTNTIQTSDSFILNATLPSDGTYYLMVQAYGGDIGSYELFLDEYNPNQASVPEPPTFVLTAAGLAACVVVVRRGRGRPGVPTPA
jgi:hypothetical protein